MKYGLVRFNETRGFIEGFLKWSRGRNSVTSMCSHCENDKFFSSGESELAQEEMNQQEAGLTQQVLVASTVLLSLSVPLFSRSLFSPLLPTFLTVLYSCQGKLIKGPLLFLCRSICLSLSLSLSIVDLWLHIHCATHGIMHAPQQPLRPVMSWLK